MRPEMKKMRCPFLRTMLSAPDAPKWDQRKQVMDIEELVRFIRDEPAGNGTVHEVLRFLSIANHGVGNRLQRMGCLVTRSGGQFSTELAGSDGDHEGDSRIYDPETGEFDAEQFARFTSFSGDGETMDIAALGQAIADAGKRHNGTPVTAVESAAEFALLCILLGDDNGAIRIADMRRLFEANEFPAGAREKLRSRTREQWFSLTMRIIEAVSSAALGGRDGNSEMKPDRLKHLLEVLFGPLLAGRQTGKPDHKG